MTKKEHTHHVELTTETYELLQQVKKAFVSYTGENLEDRTDSKVIDVLTGGFFDSMVRGEVDAGHDHDHGCCGGDCASDGDKKECCGGACAC